MFRRAIRMEIWHSTPVCPFWPAVNYEEQAVPNIGVRCANCLKLDRRQQGRAAPALKGLVDAKAA